MIKIDLEVTDLNLKEMKIKDYIIVFLKGILLGLVSVGIPGVSASTIGIIIGIYFLMVDAIANIFKDFKHNFLFLLFLILGYGIGSIGAAFSITILFEKFPFVTTFIIIGLICASIPEMIIKLKKDYKNISCWITFIVVLLLLLAYNLTLSTGSVQEFPTNPDIPYLIKMGVIGAVTSATFVIPGIDFAVVFLSLGIYYPFMNMITSLLSFGSEDYMTYFVGNIQILGFYLLGYFVGVFLFSKLIKLLSAKYNSQTQFASLAFIVAAPFIVIKSCIIDNEAFHTSTGQIVLVIIASITAFILLLSLKIIRKRKSKILTNEEISEYQEKN